jgi:ribokinase
MQDLARIADPGVIGALRETAARSRIAAIGAVNYDEIFILPGKMRDDGASYVTEKRLLAGGHAANCASALAGLGCHSAVIGAVGRDALGRWLIEDLIAHGIDVSHVAEVDAPTGRAIIPVFEDSHFMILERGANEHFVQSDPSTLEQFDALTVFDPGIAALESLIGLLSDMRSPPAVYWTPGGRYASDPILPRMCPFLQALFLNVAEAEDFRRHHRDSIAAYPDIVLVETYGASGATCTASTHMAHAPGFLTTCVDPTGAGDHFAACFILADQAGLPWSTSLQIANLGGMIAVETVGARARDLTLDRIEAEILRRKLFQ